MGGRKVGESPRSNKQQRDAKSRSPARFNAEGQHHRRRQSLPPVMTNVRKISPERRRKSLTKEGHRPRALSLPPERNRRKSKEVEDQQNVNRKLDRRGRQRSVTPSRKKRQISHTTSQKRRKSAEIFYEKLRQIPKFQQNKTAEEVALYEMARKRVARREYYGLLISERYKEHLRNKKEGRTRRKLGLPKLSDVDIEDLPIENESNPELFIGTTTSLPFDVTEPVPKQVRQKSHGVKTKASNTYATQLIINKQASHTHRNRAKAIPAEEINHSDNEQPDTLKHFLHKSNLTVHEEPKTKRSSHKSDHSDNSHESANSAKSNRSQRSTKRRSNQKRAESTVDHFENGVSLHELLKQLEPLASRHSKHHIKVGNHIIIDPVTDASDHMRRRRVLNSDDLTPESSLRLRNLGAPGGIKPEDDAHYRQIYAHRRSVRLAKIKGQLAKKHKAETSEPSSDKSSEASLSETGSMTPRHTTTPVTSIENIVKNGKGTDELNGTDAQKILVRDSSAVIQPTESNSALHKPRQSEIRKSHSEPLPRIMSNVPDSQQTRDKTSKIEPAKENTRDDLVVVKAPNDESIANDSSSVQIIYRKQN